jgi:hypothetical protein
LICHFYAPSFLAKKSACNNRIFPIATGALLAVGFLQLWRFPMNNRAHNEENAK